MREFLSRTWDRFFWSRDGLCDTWKSENSFRYWVYANLISGAAAFLLPLDSTGRALRLALGILVLVVELLNTGIEHTVDYISTERHPLAKKAKDAGSAAAMVAVGEAGAMAAGAKFTSRRVVEAASMVVGLSPQVKTLSSFFLMVFDDRPPLIFSDCAINVAPDARALAEIAQASAKTGQALLGEARVALL